MSIVCLYFSFSLLVSFSFVGERASKEDKSLEDFEHIRVSKLIGNDVRNNFRCSDVGEHRLPISFPPLSFSSFRFLSLVRGLRRRIKIVRSPPPHSWTTAKRTLDFFKPRSASSVSLSPFSYTPPSPSPLPTVSRVLKAFLFMNFSFFPTSARTAWLFLLLCACFSFFLWKRDIEGKKKKGKEGKEWTFSKFLPIWFRIERDDSIIEFNAIMKPLVSLMDLRFCV